MTNDQIRSLARSRLNVFGHLAALEIAALVHLLLERRDLLLVDEHLELARLR